MNIHERILNEFKEKKYCNEYGEFDSRSIKDNEFLKHCLRNLESESKFPKHGTPVRDALEFLATNGDPEEFILTLDEMPQKGRLSKSAFLNIVNKKPQNIFFTSSHRA
jgi:hypothetical protein